MAVADGVVPSPPPPPPPASRNIVASLARRRVGRAAADAVTGAVVCVFFASLWLVGAGGALSVIGRRAYGEGNSLDAAASKILQGAGVTIALSCPISLVLVGTRMACWGPVAVAEEDDQVQAPARKSIAKVAQELLHNTLALGFIVSMAFILLILVGELLKSKSIKGTRHERIGSMISDMGSLGTEAIYCLLILPISAVKIWKSCLMH